MVGVAPIVGKPDLYRHAIQIISDSNAAEWLGFAMNLCSDSKGIESIRGTATASAALAWGMCRPRIVLG